MAKVQIKPTSSGSFVDATGKNASHISSLPVALQSHALHATALLAFVAGAAGPVKSTADKNAAAVGRVLQWV